MNIFVLDLDPRRCARYHCDFHVGKMITEDPKYLPSVTLVLPLLHDQTLQAD